jgi:inositol-pentakisphosphate 2-kinase
MPFSLSQTSPSEWKYISEGAATVVFSYNGPHHPILSGRVLRLRKAPREGHDPRHSASDDNLVAFQQCVVSRLLDPSYLPDLQTIPLQADWVEALSIHHESFRPQERRSTSVIDCSRQTGVLAPDLISGLSCAVEVKVIITILPKCRLTISPKAKMGLPT